MAKLSVVVPSNEVEVNGQKYRKVERKAQAGDIVQITDRDAPYFLPKGAFFAVNRVDSWGDAVVVDEDGDDFDIGSSNIDFEVYEKVSEPATPEYREVKREAIVGDRIRIVNAGFAGDPPSYKNGEEFIVTALYEYGGVRINRKWVNNGSVDAWVAHREYVVLEPVNYAEPERLKVGEYAKVVGSSNGLTHRGDIVKITEDDNTGVPFKLEFLNGEEAGWQDAESLVRATESEVEAAKKAAERAKNIGEFADDGYAEIVAARKGALTGFSNGDYVEVFVNNGGFALRVEHTNGTPGYCDADALRKVTREEYEAATEPRLKVGDLARTLVGKDVPKGAIVRITRDDRSALPYRGELLDGSEYDWYAPEQLEKVSAEEAKWTTIGRKVNEFRRGDIVENTKRREYVRVEDVGSDLLGLRSLNGYFTATPKVEVKLIVPVEQRFDLAEGGADLSR